MNVNNSNNKFQNFGNQKDGISTLLTILADGTYLKPFLIFKGGVTQAVASDVNTAFFNYNSSKAGNMTEELFLLYVEHVSFNLISNTK